MHFDHPKQLLDHDGADLGSSDWMLIDQARINGFADDTDDHQWIHIDAERAKSGPFGTTIAHGYLMLSLAPAMLAQVIDVDNVQAAVKYGVNKVRFPAPVPVASRVRGSVTLRSATPRGMRSRRRSRWQWRSKAIPDRTTSPNSSSSTCDDHAPAPHPVG